LPYDSNDHGTDKKREKKEIDKEPDKSEE